MGRGRGPLAASSCEAQGTQQTVGGAGVSGANGVSPTPEFPVTGNQPEPVLVHNVDILSDLDLAWFRAQHREGALATLLVMIFNYFAKRWILRGKQSDQ